MQEGSAGAALIAVSEDASRVRIDVSCAMLRSYLPAPEHTCACGTRNIKAPAADDHHAEEARVLDVREDTRYGH